MSGKLLAISLTIFFYPVIALSEEYFLYCEATRHGDGARVNYEFHISNGIAEATYGKWRVIEKPSTLVLKYLNEDGSEQKGTVIRINRYTGELFHSALGGVSVYSTQDGDQFCTRLERHF